MTVAQLRAYLAGHRDDEVIILRVSGYLDESMIIDLDEPVYDTDYNAVVLRAYSADLNTVVES